MARCGCGCRSRLLLRRMRAVMLVVGLVMMAMVVVWLRGVRGVRDNVVCKYC